MNRIITLLVSVLSVATMWAQTTGADAIKRMNPYTCQLSHAISADGKSITFSYYLNATATSIDVMVDVNDNGEFENHEVAYTIRGPENILTRSDNQILSVTIPFTDFNAQIPRGKGPRGTGYNWALRANREAYSTATHAYPADWGRMVFNIPGGVAVNNNPENDYFGTIYVTESKTGDVKSNANGSQTNYHKNEGLYIYKSDLTQYKHTEDRTYFTGDSQSNGSDSNYENLNWSSESNDDKAPDRVCVGSDGVAFINDNRATIPDNNKSVVIWQASPEHTHVGNNRFMYAMKNSNSTLFPRASADGHPRVLSMVTMGEGDNEKLYVINAYKRETVGNVYQYYPILTRYSLSDTYGNQITNEETAAKEKNWRLRTRSENYQTHLVYDGTKYSIANATTSMASGVHNDLWIAQRREASIEGVPSLVHVKFSGDDLTCDYVIDANKNSELLERDPSDGGASPYGALALNTDGTMLAIASDGYINVMDVTYSSNNTPTLTRNADKSKSLGPGKSCNGLAFDKANNLYAVSQDTHQFYIYAMPGQASTTIPAKSSLKINIPHVITLHPTPTTTKEAELVYPSYTPSAVSRDGYVFEGWYFGDANSYDINAPYDPTLTNKSGHLHVWARWIKATFEEGYVTATIEDGFSQQEINALSGKGINRNEELVSCLLQNSSYLPSNSLKVNRKLQGGMYNTFMLPFALTTTLRANIKDSEGQALAEDAILTMQNVTSHTTNGETLYELVFAPASEVPAYQPFLIKPTNDLTATMTFPNVSAVEALPVQPAAEIEGVRFVPVFEPTMMGGEESNILILVADNRLAKLNGVGEMLGLRGYFDVGDTFSSASYVMKIVDKTGVVTYVGDATAPQKGSVAIKLLHNGQIYILRGDEVYDLNGRLLRKQ